MSVLQSLNETSEKAVDVGELYYQKTKEYYKLKVFQQLTLTLSILCKIALIGGLLFMSLVFFAVGGTIALANVLEDIILACSIIGIGLILLALIVYILRKKIETFIIRKTAKNFFD